MEEGDGGGEKGGHAMVAILVLDKVDLKTE